MDILRKSLAVVNQPHVPIVKMDALTADVNSQSTPALSAVGKNESRIRSVESVDKFDLAKEFRSSGPSIS